jgi:ABC-type transport system substrate-binding protein
MHFVVINPGRISLAEPVLRHVLFCVVTDVRARNLTARAFVPSGNMYWSAPEASNPCPLIQASSLAAVELLKSNGYSWRTEPSETQPGEGIIMPDGAPLAPITVLTSSEMIDPLRSDLASQMEESARDLGIPLATRSVSSVNLRYAVFSSGEYDMAILGWRVSEYPGYLCDWFEPPSPFAYSSDRLTAACNSFNSTADLAAARQAAYQVQTILMEDLPFIPLHQVLGYEIYRDVAYPFDSVLNGLSGLYGAPALAIPAP